MSFLTELWIFILLFSALQTNSTSCDVYRIFWECTKLLKKIWYEIVQNVFKIISQLKQILGYNEVHLNLYRKTQKELVTKLKTKTLILNIHFIFL